jgi:hypothetical protein
VNRKSLTLRHIFWPGISEEHMFDTGPKRAALREHLESAMALAEELHWTTTSFIIGIALEDVRQQELIYNSKERSKR